MSDKIKDALQKVKSFISKDCYVLSHSVQNNKLVAIIAKKEVGSFKNPVTTCVKLHVAL